MEGTVVTLLGKACTVRADGQRYVCYLRGRLFETPGTQIAVGDRVEFDPVEEAYVPPDAPDRDPTVEGVGVIHNLLPRRNSLSRPSPRRGAPPQVIAANLDQIVVVSALKNPPLRTGLIDRYLIIAHRAGIAAALSLNKIDLAGPGEREEVSSQLRPYRDLGLPLAVTSAVTGEGMEELAGILRHKRSVLVGHSGVGKSKLAARIQPGLVLVSSQVSRKGKGRHTTSAAHLFPLDLGGELVDTPGVRELGVSDLAREELDQHFLDFAPHLGRCRFKSCSHLPEPGCAVKEALEAGLLYRARYESYAHLYRELKTELELRRDSG
jgi:ribosome biogenesis GTPase